MKKSAILLLVLLLTACAETSAERRAAELQEALLAMPAYRAEVKADLPRETETLHYAFTVEHDGEETVVTLTEPELLADVTATLTDGALRLSYGGVVLDAGTAGENVSGVNCAPLFLRAMAEGYVLRSAIEEFADEEKALFLVCESECSGEVLNYRGYFAADGTPLYGEIEKNEEIIAFLEFTNFKTYDTMASNTDAA